MTRKSPTSIPSTTVHVSHCCPHRVSCLPPHLHCYCSRNDSFVMSTSGIHHLCRTPSTRSLKDSILSGENGKHLLDDDPGWSPTVFETALLNKFYFGLHVMDGGVHQKLLLLHRTVTPTCKSGHCLPPRLRQIGDAAWSPLGNFDLQMGHCSPKTPRLHQIGDAALYAANHLVETFMNSHFFVFAYCIRHSMYLSTPFSLSSLALSFSVLGTVAELASVLLFKTL